MKITWFGHSCFMIETSHGKLVFDPFENGYVPGYKDIPKDTEADEVICSHEHEDHNAAHLIRPTGKKHSYNIKKLPTYHDEEKGALRGNNNITIVEFDGIKLVHMGDIGCPLTPSQIEELMDTDILMIPVGGYYTIDSAMAYKISQTICAKMTIPMHYRGNGFGFDVLEKVDDFLYFAGSAAELSGNVLELEKEDISKYPVVVFSKP